jgi:integrase
MYYSTRGNSLEIRFTYEGKRGSLSLPKSNSPVGIAHAEMKMAEMKKDMAHGSFDTTLLKYKPRYSGRNHTVITAVELVQKYAASRQKSISHSSIERLRAISSKLGNLLGDKPAEKVTDSVAKDAVKRWSESASTQSIKIYLFMLRACWKWAKGKYHVAEVNPWSGCLERLNDSGNNSQSPQPEPFAIVELQTIIASFDAHPQYCHYTDFVRFLASTACRPCEAIALKWKHFGTDFTTVWIGESISRGHQNKKGTKTGKSRTVQLSPSLQLTLRARFDQLSPRPDELVFPSPRGIPINDHRFRGRAWNTIIATCDVKHENPYNLRHSAISHALANGANPYELAEQTGHSVKVMFKTYAHVINRKCHFVDIG